MVYETEGHRFDSCRARCFWASMPLGFAEEGNSVERTRSGRLGPIGPA